MDNLNYYGVFAQINYAMQKILLKVGKLCVTVSEDVDRVIMYIIGTVRTALIFSVKCVG